MCPITSRHCGQASRASKALGIVSLGPSARKALRGFSGSDRWKGWPRRTVPIMPAACLSVAFAKRGDQCAVQVRPSGAMATSASSALVMAGRARSSASESREACANSTSVSRHVSAEPFTSLPVTITWIFTGGAPAGMVCVVDATTSWPAGSGHSRAVSPQRSAVVSKSLVPRMASASVSDPPLMSICVWLMW